MSIHAIHPSPAIDPFLDEWLRGAVALGALLVLLIPAARGHHAAVGWLPLWLVGMPLASWWALYRFRLPWQWPAANAERIGSGRRRSPGQPQARRRSSSVRTSRKHAA